MTAERVMPWLQDTATDNVWHNWNVTYRDFQILDSQNRVVAVYNLTQHDLSVVTNRAALTQLLLQAAHSIDSMGTGLPDDWKQQYFHALTVTPEADADGDGLNNFTEFAFGTDPTGGGSAQPLRAWLSGAGASRVLNLQYRRRAGGFLNYVVETSPDLVHWSSGGGNLRVVKAAKNLFDGTGTAQVSYALAAPVGAGAPGFLRVLATPRAR